jgi:hypothetical protein
LFAVIGIFFIVGSFALPVLFLPEKSRYTRPFQAPQRTSFSSRMRRTICCRMEKTSRKCQTSVSLFLLVVEQTC